MTDPNEISEHLRRNGIEPSSAVHAVEVDPFNVKLLEGWHAPANKSKARDIARDGKILKRVLLVDRGDHYETVDGVHRTEAARIMGIQLPALVIGERVFEMLFKPYGERAMHEWAHTIHDQRDFYL